MTGWRKSSRSGGDSDPACLELAKLVDGIWVRDSKDPDGGRLESQNQVDDQEADARRRAAPDIVPTY